MRPELTCLSLSCQKASSPCKLRSQAFWWLPAGSPWGILVLDSWDDPKPETSAFIPLTVKYALWLWNVLQWIVNWPVVMSQASSSLPYPFLQCLGPRRRFFIRCVHFHLLWHSAESHFFSAYCCGFTYSTFTLTEEKKKNNQSFNRAVKHGVIWYTGVIYHWYLNLLNWEILLRVWILNRQSMPCLKKI